MKIIAVTAAVALCAALLLSRAVSQAPAPAAGGEPAEELSLPRYRVMHAFGIPEGPAIPGEGEKHRKALEDALNKADADGYQLAGMNINGWCLNENPMNENPNRAPVAR